MKMTILDEFSFMINWSLGVHSKVSKANYVKLLSAIMYRIIRFPFPFLIGSLGLVLVDGLNFGLTHLTG